MHFAFSAFLGTRPCGPLMFCFQLLDTKAFLSWSAFSRKQTFSPPLASVLGILPPLLTSA